VKTVLRGLFPMGLVAVLMACGNGTTQTAVRLSSSATDVRFSGSVTLTAVATDNRSLKKVEFFEGSAKLGAVSSAPYTWRVNYRAANSGQKRYSAVATDTSGNSQESESLVVNVAITPGFATVGGALDINNTQQAFAPAMALDSGGNPVVVWSERDYFSRKTTYFKRWDGTAWVPVGTGFKDATTDLPVFNHSLVLDSNGNPVVVSAEVVAEPYNSNIYVMRWDGTAWVRVGTEALNIDLQRSPSGVSLALDSSGNPVVAWSEWSESGGTSSDHVYVKRWNGTAWVLVGNDFLDSNNNQFAGSPSLALDPSGNPMVAWYEADGSTTSNKIYVKRWDGTAWVPVGTGFKDETTNRPAYDPSLVLDSGGNPVVAWRETFVSSSNVFVNRWNGTAWIPVGKSSLKANTKGGAYDFSLALDSDGNPVLAWLEFGSITKNHLYVSRWNGSTWNSVGDSSVDSGKYIVALGFSLDLDSSGNAVVAFRYFDNPSGSIFVKRFNN
jgi:Bacterial Ig domain